MFFANFAAAQICFPSGYFITATTRVFRADSPAAGSLALSMIAATPDDDKKHWSGVNLTVDEKPFIIDYANFIAQHNMTFVEFYVQIGYNRLSFTREGKFYQAIYDIDLYIEDLNGNLLQTQSARDKVRVTDYDDTTAPNNFRISLLSFYLRPGLYRRRAVITDKETGKRYDEADKVFVRDFSGQSLMLSDVQFSRNIETDSSANAFVKHNRRIEPNVPHAYGQFGGQLFVYYEIYNLVDPRETAARDSLGLQALAPDSFRTLYLIHNDKGEEVKQLWKFSRKPGTSCVQSVVLPIADLKSGLYTLTVRVFDNASATYAEVSGRFSMQWDIFSFKDKKFEEILEQLQYVASDGELKKLAQMPEAERQRGLFEFWQRRDPTPGTPRNEAMEEYYRRINYANAYFKWQRGEGWKSPQGQIYITYGPPDYVQRYNSSSFDLTDDGRKNSDWSAEAWQGASRLVSRRSKLFNKIYEVWQYTQLNRSFVFVDSRNVGMYELVDPLMLNHVDLR
ncbi:MAG: GWxTD domain-containing protein [candidate division KSB1 bacterium]|nr:GWxTD domain-containing protein [candidate division KSB1 bacterium]